MAIQAQLYPENLGLPLMGGGGGGGGVINNVSQDWFFNNNQVFNNFANNNNNLGCFNEISSNNNNNLQQQKHQQQFQFQQQQQQQEALLQLQQQYLLQLQNQQQQQQRNSCVNNNDDDNEGFVFMGSSKNCTPTTTASTTTSDSDYRVPINISPSFANTLEKQRQEIDRFITLQNERLKLALQEQRKQQLTTMMRKLEARAKQLILEKDEEIAKASKRRYELEEVIRKMQVENQEWQRIAAENEAMVVSLNNTLEQIKQQQLQQLDVCCSSSCSSNEVGDAESCCNEGNFVNRKRARVEETEDFETEEKKTGVMCKVCNSGKSCVLLLPCRHLCCCKECVDFVDVCPVCKSQKKACIEALFS